MRLEDFFFFSQVEKVFLVLPKSETISLSFLRDFNLIFKDLPECWCFAAEMVTMPDVWYGFLQNENKQA